VQHDGERVHAGPVERTWTGVLDAADDGDDVFVHLPLEDLVEELLAFDGAEPSLVDEDGNGFDGVDLEQNVWTVALGLVHESVHLVEQEGHDLVFLLDAHVFVENAFEHEAAHADDVREQFGRGGVDVHEVGEQYHDG